MAVNSQEKKRDPGRTAAVEEEDFKSPRKAVRMGVELTVECSPSIP